jgi:hypothetical protein
VKVNFDVPKEKVDELLIKQIDALKKEVKRLKAQLEKVQNANAYTERQRQEIGDMYAEFKTLCDKFGDHDSCQQ